MRPLGGSKENRGPQRQQPQQQQHRNPLGMPSWPAASEGHEEQEDEDSVHFSSSSGEEEGDGAKPASSSPSSILLAAASSSTTKAPPPQQPLSGGGKRASTGGGTTTISSSSGGLCPPPLSHSLGGRATGGANRLLHGVMKGTIPSLKPATSSSGHGGAGAGRLSLPSSTLGGGPHLLPPLASRISGGGGGGPLGRQRQPQPAHGQEAARQVHLLMEQNRRLAAELVGVGEWLSRVCLLM